MFYLFTEQLKIICRLSRIVTKAQQLIVSIPSLYKYASARSGARPLPVGVAVASGGAPALSLLAPISIFRRSVFNCRPDRRVSKIKLSADPSLRSGPIMRHYPRDVYLGSGAPRPLVNGKPRSGLLGPEGFMACGRVDLQTGDVITAGDCA
jgi:hypothetical protein